MNDKHENGTCEDAKWLFATIAQVNNSMIALRAALGSNPLAHTATRGCDIRRYGDFASEQDVYIFESYVEVETRSKELFCWSMDLTLSSEGWKVQRTIAKRTNDGEQIRSDFEDSTFRRFCELADNISPLVKEFVDSASSFKF